VTDDDEDDDDDVEDEGGYESVSGLNGDSLGRSVLGDADIEEMPSFSSWGDSTSINEAAASLLSFELFCFFGDDSSLVILLLLMQLSL